MTKVAANTYMRRLGSIFECFHFNMINWPAAFYYDNNLSRRERER